MTDMRVWTSDGWKELRGTPDGRAITTSSIRVIKNIRNIAAAGDYLAEDVISDSATDGAGTPWLFTNVDKSGCIFKATAFIQTTALGPRLTLFLFSKKPTSELDDNAVNVAPSIADIHFYIGKIDFPAMEDIGGVSESLATPNTSGNLPMVYGDCDNVLYGIAVTRDAITGETANDKMGFILEVEVY